MQIASTRKDCTCDTCKNPKANNSSDAKSITENGANNSSNHQKPRSRQAKAKNRYPFGNQHRLDHTYAANFVEMPKFNKVVNSRKERTTTTPTTSDSPQDKDSQEEIVIVDIVNDENDSKISNGCISDFEKTNDEDINVKSNWLRNLCLEYQPASKEKPQNNLNGVSKDDHSNLNSVKNNGVTKQYRKSRKFNKTVCLSSLFPNKPNKSMQEDNKRWIAALALMELAQSK